MPAWPVAPPKIGGCSPLHARPPKGAAHWRAERCFFRGACPRKKRILVGSAGCGRRKSATLALPGESVGSEKPVDACGASPLGRKGQRMSMGCALPGESVGSERPADAYGVCPAGRVRWGGKAGGYIWGVPCRASLLGRKGRRMPAGQSVGMERPAEICDAFWVRCGNGFPAAGPCFRFGKNFFEVAAHLAGLIRYTG